MKVQQRLRLIFGFFADERYNRRVKEIIVEEIHANVAVKSKH